MLSPLVNTCDQQNDTWRWTDMSNLKSLRNGKRLPRGWDSCMWPVDLLLDQVTRWEFNYFPNGLLPNDQMTDACLFVCFFRLVNSLSKMYLKSDVQLLPSTLLPNCLPSHHPRSLPKCNTTLCTWRCILLPYVNKDFSSWLPVPQIVIPTRVRTVIISRYPACCSWH